MPFNRERNILEQVNNISPRFQDGIKAFSNSPIIGEVTVRVIVSFLFGTPICLLVSTCLVFLQIRGTGLISGIDFTDNKSPNRPFPPEWGIFLLLSTVSIQLFYHWSCGLNSIAKRTFESYQDHTSYKFNAHFGISNQKYYTLQTDLNYNMLSNNLMNTTTQRFLIIWRLDIASRFVLTSCPFNTGIAAYFGEMCEKHGMLVRVSGDTITMSPALIVSPEEVDEVPNRF